MAVVLVLVPGSEVVIAIQPGLEVLCRRLTPGLIPIQAEVRVLVLAVSSFCLR